MANVKAIYERPLKGLDTLGHELSFYIRVILAVPRTISHYPREIIRLLAEVTLGSGALAVIGGTIGVILGMTFFTGAQVGLSGYAALNQLGTAAFAEALRKELGNRNIRVCLVEPGFTQADFHYPDLDAEKQKQMVRDEKMLRSEDIAVAVHYVLTQPRRAVVQQVTVAPLRKDDE